MVTLPAAVPFHLPAFVSMTH
jgi:hypothetical protein